MILVTGAAGFVGSAVIAESVRRGLRVRGSVRAMPAARVEDAEYVAGYELSDDTDWLRALAGVDTVIHTAARVHVMTDRARDPLTEYRRINVDGTLKLARQAAAAGVRRFVFISSLKVNGECSKPGRPFRSGDVPAPVDPYGISKWEAECALHGLARNRGMDLAIIRPPLVYGPGVRANFAALLGAIVRGVPLPLGAIRNKRSLIALDNLVDFVLTCAAHPAQVQGVFLVSDGEDLATPELVTRIASALQRPAKLFNVPRPMLMMGAAMFGRADMLRRLVDSLQVDSSDAQSLAAWSPRVSVDEGLRRTVQPILEGRVRLVS